MLGQTLSRYEVEYDRTVSRNLVGRLQCVKSDTLFETAIIPPQLRFFDLGEILG